MPIWPRKLSGRHETSPDGAADPPITLQRPAHRRIAFPPRPEYISAVSLTEIKTAVEALSPDELTELAAFIRERDNAAWDRQIDSDFSDDGRLSSVAEEVRADLTGRHGL